MQERPPNRSPRPKSASRPLKGLALLIVVVLLVLSGCGAPPASVADQLVQAINAQQTDAALRLFARDAVVTVGDLPPFSGRREIQTWLEGLFADNVNIQLAEPQVLEQGENSFAAHYSLTMSSASELGVASLRGSGEMTTLEGRITTLSFSLSEGSRTDLLRAMLGSGTVLSYAVLTDPHPMRARDGHASLTLAVTNNTQDPVPVRSIVLRLPEGDGAQDLTQNISGVNSEAPTLWHLSKREGRFTLAPELPEDGILKEGDQLVITLSDIEINAEPGVWNLEIVEDTGSTFTRTLPLAKLPFVLYVSDLDADPLVVEPGGSTTLSWDGSEAATYWLFDGQTQTRVFNYDSPYPVDGLTQTTTFYLTATVDGPEQTVVRERTVTVVTP
jgi:hypothetical protein